MALASQNGWPTRSDVPKRDYGEEKAGCYLEERYMALWYNAHRTISRDKFESVRRMGVERHATERYKDYTYHFVHYRTGTTLPRSVYHASISDRHGRRVAYLTSFRSPREAAQAARSWIDTATNA